MKKHLISDPDAESAESAYDMLTNYLPDSAHAIITPVPDQPYPTFIIECEVDLSEYFSKGEYFVASEEEYSE